MGRIAFEPLARRLQSGVSPMPIRTTRARGLFLIGVVGAAISTAAGCAQLKQADMVRTVPVALKEPREHKVLEWAIETSLARNRWVILEHSNQTYVAQFSEHGQICPKLHQDDVL